MLVLLWRQGSDLLKDETFKNERKIPLLEYKFQARLFW